MVKGSNLIYSLEFVQVTNLKQNEAKSGHVESTHKGGN